MFISGSNVYFTILGISNITHREISKPHLRSTQLASKSKDKLVYTL